MARSSSIFACVHQTLKPGVVFLMNIEHPMFIAGVHQEWICDNAGKTLYWPVNNYFLPDGRSTDFLGLRHASNTIYLRRY